jgi:hypothetical protein
VRLTGRRKIAAVAAGVALLPVFAIGSIGCEGPQEQVATLAEGPASVAPAMAKEQALVAAQMVECLRGQGVPAVLNEWEDGQAEVAFEEDEPWILCQEQDGMCHGGGTLPIDPLAAEAQQKVMDTLAAKYQPEFSDLPFGVWGVSYLIVGGFDYTDAYRACTKAIDYVPPILLDNPAGELREKQAIAQASNNWAACARQNGFPTLADAEPPKADGFLTRPHALVPMSATVDRLKALFEDCPVEDYPYENQWPSVAVDMPLYDGRKPLRDVGPLDPDEVAAAQELMDVIGAALPRTPVESEPPE